MTLASGSRLGPYEIVSQLGSGGMGVVYTATDPRLKRTVAIKLLPPDLTRDETAKQRFLQEAVAASALDHPNICTIFEINETDDGQLYLVMAHYEGETLKERIGRGPLELHDAIDIATQVGEGLAEAHGAGIVHRDIKPANLLVTKTGVVKILDFGLAKLAGTEGVTQTGTAVGTVAYMSPEQARGQQVDHRTDIWSLGVVLYEMLAGTPPFQGENLLSLSNAIMDGEPSLLTGASSSAHSVVARALNKDKAKRYLSVSDLLAEMRTLRSGADAATVATSAHTDVPSIAVLPFADMSPEKDQDYFCEGMAEEIINALTKLENLRVVARTSAFQFKGQAIDLREVGRKLDVTSVLEGSVRKAGNRLRVTAQLINVDDGYHLWSERYDRVLDDVFEVQDEIASSVVDHLRVELLGSARAPVVKRPTESLEAYECFMKGRHYRFTRYDVLGASQWFEKAIEHDSGFAAAHAGLADAITMAAVHWVIPPREALAKAKQALKKALQLDAGLAEAYETDGRVRFWLQWDWDAAERAFRRALELNPASVEACCGYGSFLMYLGRPMEALVQFGKARELDPLSAYAVALDGLALYFARRYDEAILKCEQALELVPDYALAHMYLNWINLSCERYEEALRHVEMMPETLSLLTYRSISRVSVMKKHSDMSK